MSRVMAQIKSECPITISLVAPIYGVEKFIAKFADSVLGQSYPYIQYVFVNDGTKDASMVILNDIILKKYAYRKKHIVIVNKENGGLPAARQTGLQYVTGDYVLHVDSDDWLAEDAIESIVSRIEETGSEVVYFDYVKEYPNKSKIKRERLYDISVKDVYIRDMYAHKVAGSVWNKCVKTTLYTEHELYIPRYGYAEDCCLCVQLLGYASSITYLNEALYHYRKGNPQAMTRQGIRKRKWEYIENFLNLYEAYRDVPDGDNPIACIVDDILIQAGWYSILYNFKLFVCRPYLAREIRRSRIRKGTNVWVGFQILTKLYALFR